MASAFDRASRLEKRSMARVMAWLAKRGDTKAWMLSTDADVKFFQRLTGDIQIVRQGRGITLERKAEERYTGNLFLETWSNRSRFEPGWLYTCHASWILYHFLCDDPKTDVFYLIRGRSLKEWCFNGDRIYKENERRQNKYDQENDTWGRCVSILKLWAGLPEGDFLAYRYDGKAEDYRRVLDLEHVEHYRKAQAAFEQLKAS